MGETEERPSSTASNEEKFAMRRPANRVSRRKDSDDDQPTGSQEEARTDAVLGLTLKDWFDAT